MNTIKTWRERIDCHPDQDPLGAAEQAMQGEIDELRAALAQQPSQYGSPELQDLILAKLAQPAQEPEVWFCPDCGRVSESQVKCCPDWIRARKVPKNFEMTCAKTFELAIREPAQVPLTDCPVISGYAIPVSDKRFADEILIQRSRQIEGPPLWVVRLNGDCLNKNGEWEYEPMPSSRDDAFLARCRFESAESAIQAAHGIGAKT